MIEDQRTSRMRENDGSDSFKLLARYTHSLDGLLTGHNVIHSGSRTLCCPTSRFLFCSVLGEARRCVGVVTSSLAQFHQKLSNLAFQDPDSRDEHMNTPILVHFLFPDNG